MNLIIAPFITLYASVFLLMAGVGLLGTYLPLRLTVDGISTQFIGFIMSAYFFEMCIGALYCPRLIRSVGHIRAFAAFAATTTSVVVLHGLFISPLLWVVLRFLSGLSTIGLYTVIESWLNECTVPTLRGRVMSVYMFVSYLGMGGSQYLLNFSPIQDMRTFFIICLLLMLCIVPISVTKSIYPELPHFDQVSVRRLIRKAPVGILGCFLAGLLNGAFYAIVPVFCHIIGLSIMNLSTVMSLTILGGMVLQWPVGVLSDRFDRTYMLASLCLAVALTGILIVFVAEYSFFLFLLVMILFGGLIFTIYPVSVARAHDLFDSAEIVPASSVLLLCFCFGATAGPVAASLTMTVTETGYAFFVYCAAVSLLSAVIIFYLRKKEVITIVAAEDHSSFIPMKGTSPAAVLIDPRTEMDNEAGTRKRQ
ncbi:MAG: MFS transporter [Desulfofustis sp.]|nr:MFS transporter [Desulfofustis sp.]